MAKFKEEYMICTDDCNECKERCRAWQNGYNAKQTTLEAENEKLKNKLWEISHIARGEVRRNEDEQNR